MQTCPGLRAEEVDGSDLSGVIVGELGVGVAAGEHHVSQGVPARLDRGQVLELAVRVGDGAQQVEVRTLVYSEGQILKMYS